jgi:hypothetical protein
MIARLIIGWVTLDALILVLLYTRRARPQRLERLFNWVLGGGTKRQLRCRNVSANFSAPFAFECSDA